MLATKHSIRLFFTLFLWALAPALWAQGQVLPVTNLNESGPGSLRGVVGFSQPGDTVFIQSTGTIRLDSQIFISKNLVIAGNGPAINLIGANGQTRLFEVDSADTVVFRNLALIDGDAYDYVAPEPRGGGAIRTRGRVELYNCLFENNQAVIGGAILLEAFSEKFPSVYAEGCTFFQNRALEKTETMERGNGGAMYTDARNQGEGRITTLNCTFTQNTADLSGGAIYLLGDPAGGASFKGDFCTFTQNSAERCGGIDNSQAELGRISNSLVAGNLGEQIRPELFGTWRSGGHNLIADTSGIVFVTGSPQTSDLIEVAPQLGPVYLDPSGHFVHSLSCGSPALDAADPTFGLLLDGRGATRDASPDIGSWERIPGDLTVTNLNDRGANSLRIALQLACPGDTLQLAGLSGVLRLESPLAIQQNVFIRGNEQESLIFDGGDSVRLIDIDPGVRAGLSWLTFRKGGPALFGGGAIRNKGRLTVSNSTFRGNKAQAGGAIANYGEGDTAVFEAINCSFAQNQAVVLDGGALDNRGITHPSISRLIHCTLSENSAASRGGCIYNQFSQPDTLADRVVLQGSLVAGNTAFEGEDLFGNFHSEGPNLVQTTDGYQLNSSFFTELSGVDPLLDPLGQYGGPTLTFRLQAGSPAIDAAIDTGFLPGTDQRGLPRIFNAIPDIGAYEYDPATSVEESILWASLKLFPQPAQQQVTIELPVPISGGRLEIMDLQGRMLTHTPLKRGKQHVLAINNLPGGLYLVQVKAENRSWTQKLLIR